MKRIITLLILLTSPFIFSQNLSSQLSGEWIVYKTELKDGSTYYERAKSPNTYLRFSFGEDNSFITTFKPSQIPSYRTRYTINNNIIMVANKNINTTDDHHSVYIEDNSYVIEKVTKDTLVITEDFTLSNYELKRYYCVNQLKIKSDIKKENINKDIYIANQYYLPKIKEGEFYFTDPAVNFEFSGYMIFDIVNKKITLEVLKYDKGEPDNKRIKKFIKNVEKTFDDWDTSDFSQFKKVKLPFYFRNNYGKFISTFEFSFGINTLQYSDDNPANKAKKSDELYTKGLVAYKESNYDNAIEYFTKAYQYDNSNLDALYSRAAIYYYTNKKEEACMDWKTLSELGQKKGTDSYNQYCQ